MSILRRRGKSETEHELVESRLNFSENSEFLNNINLNNQPSSFIILPDEMSCRDRTREFLSTVKSMQGRNTNGMVSLRETKTVKQLKQYSEFMRIAKLIGKDTTNTYMKLEKLTILAKRKSLFDDKENEVQELTCIIKQDLNNLNQQIAKLQDLAKLTPENYLKHMHTHSNSVIISLQSKLASMSNDFKHVLDIRTENLKQQKNRRDHFTHGTISSNLPPSAHVGYYSGSVLLADDRQGTNQVAIDMSSQHQKQLLIEQERIASVQNIESTIVELGGIFQQLALMIKEQEETVYRIDHNVENTSLNVESAHAELLKFFRSVSSSRWLMIKVFAVLIFFFIIFVVFLT